ncbi:MAG TPA: hypothetical protein VF444_20845 [Pseudonocardiaceae bacterium]
MAIESVDPALTTVETTAGLDALTSVPQVANITVDKDNVLQAASIIQNAMDGEGTHISNALRELRIAPPGADPVSLRAAEIWNQRLVDDPDSYANRVKQYLANLTTLVNNLRTSAKQYGYTDEQIAAAFNQAGSTGA